MEGAGKADAIRPTGGKLGKFDRAFDGFGPGIAEKYFVISSGEEREAFAKSGVVFGIKIRVGVVEEFCRLVLDDARDRGMVMSQIINGNARRKIEVTVLINVPDKTPFPMTRNKIIRRFGMGVGDILFVVFQDCLRPGSGRGSDDGWNELLFIVAPFFDIGFVGTKKIVGVERRHRRGRVAGFLRGATSIVPSPEGGD